MPCAKEDLEDSNVLSPEDARALEWSDPYNPRLEKFLEKEREEQVRTPPKRDAGKQLWSPLYFFLTKPVLSLASQIDSWKEPNHIQEGRTSLSMA